MKTKLKNEEIKDEFRLKLAEIGGELVEIKGERIIAFGPGKRGEREMAVLENGSNEVSCGGFVNSYVTRQYAYEAILKKFTPHPGLGF